MEEVEVDAVTLNDDCLRVVASFFAPLELVAANAVNSQWAHVCRAPALWRKAHVVEFGCDCAADARAAFREQHVQLVRAGVPSAFFRRVHLFLVRLRGSATARGLSPDILLRRLRPGVPLPALLAADASLRVPLPPSLKALLLVHDGHEDGQVEGHAPRSLRPTFLGVYAFYNTLVSPYILPLDRMLRLRADLAASNTDMKPAPRFLAITRSPWGAGGNTVMDLTTGGVYAVCSGLRLVRACPPSAPGGVPGDDLLRWLEELANRAMSGCLPITRIPASVNSAMGRIERDGGEENEEEEDEEESAALPESLVGLPPSALGLSLFPLPHPSTEGLATSACTHGVRVSVGAVFVPHSTLPGPGICIDGRTGAPVAPPPKSRVQLREGEELAGRYMFAYAARLRYEYDGAQHASVQLVSRKWEIADGGGRVERVEGPGVIGLHPLLPCVPPPTLPPVFEYASAANAVVPLGGTMAGTFSFVPGSMAEPEGQPFEAEVAQFLLRVPSFIYG